MGTYVLTTWIFWQAVLGIMSIGFMNVAVSFSLAMFVAIRARGIESPERHAIYRSLLQRLGRELLSFILPVNIAPVVPLPEVELDVETPLLEQLCWPQMKH